MLFSIPWSNLMLLLYSTFQCNGSVLSVKASYLYSVIEAITTIVMISFILGRIFFLLNPISNAKFTINIIDIDSIYGLFTLY